MSYILTNKCLFYSFFFFFKFSGYIHDTKLELIIQDLLVHKLILRTFKGNLVSPPDLMCISLNWNRNTASKPCKLGENMQTTHRNDPGCLNLGSNRWPCCFTFINADECHKLNRQQNKHIIRHQQWAETIHPQLQVTKFLLFTLFMTSNI